MLKRILIIIFLIFSQTAQATQNKISHYKVIIIGAGIAGLEAGHYLQEHGIDNYIILEARNRIGGRVNTIKPWKGVAIELGAGVIHGGDQSNPLIKLAQKWHLAIASLDSNSSSFYDPEGKEISDEIEESYEKLYFYFKKNIKKLNKNNDENSRLSVSDIVINTIKKIILAKNHNMDFYMKYQIILNKNTQLIFEIYLLFGMIMKKVFQEAINSFSMAIKTALMALKKI